MRATQAVSSQRLDRVSHGRAWGASAEGGIPARRRGFQVAAPFSINNLAATVGKKAPNRGSPARIVGFRQKSTLLLQKRLRRMAQNARSQARPTFGSSENHRKCHESRAINNLAATVIGDHSGARERSRVT